MPAGAIVAHPYMEGGRSPEDRASLMAGKRSDNASSRPYSKVNAPVVLAHGYERDSPVLFEGHHRTIGAFDRILAPHERLFVTNPWFRMGAETAFQILEWTI